MTTVVYRNGVLASDSGVYDRGVRCGAAQKAARSPNGWVGGVTGCLGDCSTFLDWLKSGMEGEAPAFKDEDSEAILVSPSGAIEWLGHGGKRFPIEAEYYALGSGFAVAMGAMEAGADAVLAIHVACKLDVYTSPPFTCIFADHGGSTKAGSDVSRAGEAPRNPSVDEAANTVVKFPGLCDPKLND